MSAAVPGDPGRRLPLEHTLLLVPLGGFVLLMAGLFAGVGLELLLGEARLLALLDPVIVVGSVAAVAGLVTVPVGLCVAIARRGRDWQAVRRYRGLAGIAAAVMLAAGLLIGEAGASPTHGPGNCSPAGTGLNPPCEPAPAHTDCSPHTDRACVIWGHDMTITTPIGRGEAAPPGRTIEWALDPDDPRVTRRLITGTGTINIIGNQGRRGQRGVSGCDYDLAGGRSRTRTRNTPATDGTGWGPCR